MLSRLWRVYGIIVRSFGFTVRPLFTFWVILAYRTWSTITFALDPLLFPSLRRTELRAPIFIVGNPRSGTTFLHRFMVKEGIGAGFELWQLLWPSLLARTLVKPVVGVLERFSPARFHGTKAHPTSLHSVETDDVLVFFRFVDGLFLWGYFLAWDEADHDDELGARLEAMGPRDFGFLREALRRNLAWHGKDRAVGKLFSMALRPEAALAAFPDAKLLYMLRDPVEVIPSGMSLVTGVLEKAYPTMLHASPEARARYLARLYKASIRLYRSFTDAWLAGKLPPDRVFIVRYDEMMSDFDGMMGRICAFIGHEPDDALRESIRKTADKQRAWKSEHDYDLAAYGLDADTIRRDAAFVYEAFGLTSAPDQSTPARQMP